MGTGRESTWLRLTRAIRGEPDVAPRPVLDVTPDFSAPVKQILEQLDEIEAVALGIYASHGLPTQPGQYARSPDNPRWKFIGKTLTAEERWKLALELGSTKGWRFCSLDELWIEDGQTPTLLSQASLMLSACRRLKQSLTAGFGARHAEDIQTALRLGADWRGAELIVGRQKAGSLKLSNIDALDTSPAPIAKPKAAKPPKVRAKSVQPGTAPTPETAQQAPAKTRKVRVRSKH